MGSSTPSSLVIIFVAYLISATSAVSWIGGNETDLMALLEFKSKITHDPLGVMSSWNHSIPLCQWTGVTCGRRHQRVTVLDLRSLKIAGSIPSHIGNLSFLRELSLQNNSFENEIPSEIGHLHRLRKLGLHNNTISGVIPANISGCRNLLAFNFADNQLVGEIPLELTYLPNLKAIELWNNKLTGTIPSSLWNMSSLILLDLGGNNLHGTISDFIGKLKNLNFLYIGSNRLSGTVPASMFNLSSILELEVGYNQLQGHLPSELGMSAPNLRYFSIGGNQFTGHIPISLSNASNLEYIQLHGNKLTGAVPALGKLIKLYWFSIFSNKLGSKGPDDLNFLSSLANITTLKLLDITGNNFGGILPEHISNYSTELTSIYLAKNHISGHIPIGIRNLINLQIFELSANQLSGSIPYSIGELQNLEHLSLAENRVSGYIPSSLGNLTKLFGLFLEVNMLQGTIPSSLGKCIRLQELDLSENILNGTIPGQIMSIPSLSIFLILSNNYLTGSLPVEIGNLKNLGELDVFGNMLSGELPSSIGGCVSLEVLLMQGNLFEGSIPSSLSSLRGLRILDLSTNNLSGEIPKFLAGSHSLQILNLSYNDFKGMVPTEGVFRNASVVSVMGNSELCGGIEELQLPLCKLNKAKEQKSNIKLILIISLVSTLSGVAVALYFLCSFLKRKKKEKATYSYSWSSLLKLSYGSILKATNGFSSENLIGMGSFGSVYKGILEQDGTIIAVKVLNLLHRGASKSFIAECEALRNIRHRNLVKILSACSGVDYQGNDFKALVYELMTNGSLDSWLHPSIRVSEAHETSKKLTLLRRLNIAIDTASALDYLHNHCETPIVHCDLKPSNVLLDSEMTGHVGDFGLAKILQEATRNSASIQTSSTGLRGTIGYAPPEYGMGSEVSTHGDVYSYGILVLEMFTGKMPTDEKFSDGLSLHSFAKSALPDHVAEISDPILIPESNVRDAHSQGGRRSQIVQECLISIFEIGVACSSELPRERLSIVDVMAQLHLIREKLLGTDMMF